MDTLVIAAIGVLFGIFGVLLVITISWIYHLAYAVSTVEAQQRFDRLSRPGYRACQCDYCRVQRRL